MAWGSRMRRRAHLALARTALTLWAALCLSRRWSLASWRSPGPGAWQRVSVGQRIDTVAAGFDARRGVIYGDGNATEAFCAEMRATPMSRVQAKLEVASMVGMRL